MNYAIVGLAVDLFFLFWKPSVLSNYIDFVVLKQPIAGIASKKHKRDEVLF